MSAAPQLRAKRAPAAKRAALPGAHEALAPLRRMMLIRAGAAFGDKRLGRAADCQREQRP